LSEAATLGTEFARAFAAKDSSRLRDLLHPDIDFRGMTPNRTWEPDGRDAVISTLIGKWLEEDDRIEALDRVEDDTVGDRQRVGYRFTVSNPDGRFVVEQQAYLAARDGQIGWMRVLCSGFRPAPSPEQ
jgi:hypothetical protein